MSINIHIAITIGIMILGGILGAYCRHIFDGDLRFGNVLQVVVPGMVASFLIPLFLSIGKSDLFRKVLQGGAGYTESLFILFGFCLLAAVSARSFVNALASQAFQKAQAAERVASQAENIAAETKNQIEETKDIVAENLEGLEDLRNVTDKDSAISHREAAILEGGFEGTEIEKAVLQALSSSDYARRSLSGIARDTGLAKDDVRKALRFLIQKDRVAEIKSQRTGSLLYQVKLQ